MKVFQVLQQEYVFRQRSTEHARPKTDSKKLLSQFLHQEKYPKKKSLCEVQHDIIENCQLEILVINLSITVRRSI
jgi:hypothetical protein